MHEQHEKNENYEIPLEKFESEVRELLDVETLKLKFTEAEARYVAIKKAFQNGEITPQEHSESAQRLEYLMHFIESKIENSYQSRNISKKLGRDASLFSRRHQE